jgi:membrane protease subunit (stomatin/prohibitin family)
MALWDFIRGELIDIVQWLDSSSDTIVYRFERKDNEIKNGAKLVVRESQVAVFVNEGQFADVFQPGTHTLSTQNLPLLSTLKGWKHGFESPFKAEVYFVNTKNFVDQKWGTKNPIMMRDPDFGVVRVRAFGSYSIRVNDATTFLREVVGTDGHFTTDEIGEQLRNLVVSRFTDSLGKSKIPVLDLAANYTELSHKIKEQMMLDMHAYGLDLTGMLIENISVPPEVEAMIDKRSSMGVLGNLNQYTQFQAANAMEQMAKNGGSGGGMTEGFGIGMGMNMANQMNQQMNQNQQPQQQQSAPPPPPPLPAFYVAANGQQTGPFDAGTLMQMVQSGQFNRNSLVWKQGMAAWTAAGQVPELGNLFASMPPPLPPPM